MIGTGHLLIGGAVGVGASFLLPGPLAIPVALGAGILSHHLLDFIPHTDGATFCPDPHRPVPGLIALVVFCEILIGLTVTGALYFSQPTKLTFAVGALAGILPDLLDEVPLWQHRFRRTAVGRLWHGWHLRWHCSSMADSWVAGIAVDVGVIMTGLWLLWR
jgi:hypothetical protein